MINLEISIRYYYNLYIKNLKSISDVVSIEKINMSSLIINHNFLKKNELNIDIYDYKNMQLYHLLVIKDDKNYILLDTFNQFIDMDSFKDKEVKCIVIDKEKIKMNFGDKISIIDTPYLDNPLNLKITDLCNKYFILYPFKEMIDKQYRIYNIEIRDYINLIEAIANLPQMINQRIFLVMKSKVKC